jgi:hypothetical protein
MAKNGGLPGTGHGVLGAIRSALKAFRLPTSPSTERYARRTEWS